jgi:hypothetical protein
MRTLHDIAHARTGDKGDTLILSLFARRPEDWDRLRAATSVARLSTHLQGIAEGEITRWELPRLHAVHFVCRNALKGGVNTSLALDTHGKTLSYAALALPLED